MTKTNRTQERTFATLAQIKGIEFLHEDCEEICPKIFAIRFRYTDPRPSRNGFVTDTFYGHAIIGKRGGIKGTIYTEGFASTDYKIQSTTDLHEAVRCVTRRHQRFN